MRRTGGRVRRRAAQTINATSAAVVVWPEGNEYPDAAHRQSAAGGRGRATHVATATRTSCPMASARTAATPPPGPNRRRGPTLRRDRHPRAPASATSA